MKFKIAAFAFIVLAEVSCAKEPTSDQIMLREISYQKPESVSLFYRFPGPIKSAAIDLKVRGEFLEIAQVKFGNGKIVQIPQSILACIRHPIMQSSFFLAVTPLSDRMEDDWQPILAVTYRPETEPAADTDDADSLPYFQFMIRDWKLDRVVVHISENNNQAIPLPVDKCPALN